MSDWDPYQNQLQLNGPTYGQSHVQYFNGNMSYYDAPNHSQYGLAQQFSDNYRNEPGSSQVTSAYECEAGPYEGGRPQQQHREGGAVKKQHNDRRNWGNGKKNERYGSGRTFHSRGDQRRTVDEAASYSDIPPPSESSRNSYEDGAKPQGNRNNYYQNNGRNRNNYYQYEDSRRFNPRSRENNRQNYYAKNYNSKSNGRNYEEYGGNPPREKNTWRKSDSNNYNRKCPSSSNTQKNLDAASQRERLEQMLSRRTLECLVCCEKVRHTDKVWSCSQCYLILHLNCTIAWADSSKVEKGWRCPACQNVCSEIPKNYHCYCGKSLEPRPVPGVIPHACGEPCMRKGRLCDHKCLILCHPGPCPDCNIMVSKFCGCGATQQSVKCSADTDIVCTSTCNKILECGLHICDAQCHTGPCNPCEKVLEQICFCGKVGRRVKCTLEFEGATTYACDDVCAKTLTCGNHECEKICHEGACGDCLRDVGKIETCPCGRTKLLETRTTCLDPIPCCDKICSKILQCGQPAAPHSCREKCHEGDCPPCPLTTLVRCRCGHMDKEVNCNQLTTKADDARCEKKCTKKRLCGKHRCNQRCCIEIEHFCPLPCNHVLTCGQHRCDRTCHSGRCHSCMETSFEELYCECGANVLYPPIPCGTRPPICHNPCSRNRPCGHEVNHSCHTGACPPCTVLSKRWCYGKHEQRSAIPCCQEEFSCGLACGRPLPCGNHRCDKPCHQGPCQPPCKQKCNVKRAQCGHPCNATCHEGPCPKTSCKFPVPITCQCGLQKSTKACIDLADEYKELEMAHLKDKMTDLLKDQSVDITDIVNKAKRPAILKILECTEDCRVLDRNRRLAIGLQIRNPDLTQKLTPRYSDFMRGWAKKDPQFCQKIHEKLTELVQLAKQSKQKSRSLSLESMNRDKRHFVHEYCEHFGCDSAAYDTEPNRNVVATAIKDKSWLPSMSLLEVIQRENGQRKVPGPVLSKTVSNKSEIVALKLPGRSVQKPSTPPIEAVDYFENPPL